MMIDVLKEHRKNLRAEPEANTTHGRMLQFTKLELLDERIAQLNNQLARAVRAEAEEWLAELIQNNQQGTT